MGNIPTWRDTAAPDASTAMQGLSIAGQNITAAGTALNKGLGDWETDSKNQASDMLARAAASYPDAASMKAAQADGSFFTKAGIDPNSGWITAAGLNNVDGRATTLLDQAGKATQNNYDQQAVAPRIAGLTNNAAQTKEQTAGLAQNREHGKVDWETEQSNLEDDLLARQTVTKLARENNTYAGLVAALGKLPNDESDDDSGNGMDDDTRAKILKLAPDVMKMYNPNVSDLPAQSAPGGIGGVQGQGGGGGQGGQTQTPNVSPNNGVGSGRYMSPAATAAMPAIAAGASQLRVDPNNLRAIISYETGGKFDPGLWGGTGGKYRGLIQFGPDEQAHYGIKDGQSVEQQMPAVVQYLKDRGVKPGDDLMTLYKIINGGNRDVPETASDGNGTIAEHVAKIAAEHGGTIGPGGAGSAPGVDVRGQNNASNGRAIELMNSIATRNNQDQATQLDYDKTQADHTSLDDMVTKLKAGSFPGADPTYIKEKLNALLTESKEKGQKQLTPATAAAILARTNVTDTTNVLNPNSWFGRPGVHAMDGTNEGGAGKSASQELTSVGEGDAQKTADTINQRLAVAAQTQAMNNARNQAYNEFVATQEAMANGRPELGATLEDKYNKLQRAQAAIERHLQQHSVGDQAHPTTNTPLFNKPGTQAAVDKQNKAESLLAAASAARGLPQAVNFGVNNMN